MQVQYCLLLEDGVMKDDSDYVVIDNLLRHDPNAFECDDD